MALRRIGGTSPQRVRLAVLACLMSLAVAACSADSEPAGTPADTTTTLVVPTAPVIALAVDDLLPAQIEDVGLEIISVSGESFAADERLAAALESMGKAPGDVSLALGMSTDATLEFLIGVLRIDEFDWAEAMEVAIAELQGLAGPTVDVAAIDLGGRRLLRISTSGEPFAAPMYYYALGDVLVFAQAADEGVVASVLDEMPHTESVAASSPPAAAPPVGATDIPGLGMVVVQHLDNACLHWTEVFVFQMWYVGAHPNAMFFPVSVSVNFLPHGQRLGDATAVISQSGITAIARLEYRPHTVGASAGPAGERDEIVFSVVDTLNGIYGEYSTGLFDVDLCLSGRWQDGDRVLRLEHRSATVTADLFEGSFRCADEGRAFTAIVRGAEPTGELILEGDDLLVCNPPGCVEEGKLPSEDRVPFEGSVHRDGSTITITWESKFYDHDCDFVRFDPRSFAVHLIEAGPPRPR